MYIRSTDPDALSKYRRCSYSTGAPQATTLWAQSSQIYTVTSPLRASKHRLHKHKCFAQLYRTNLSCWEQNALYAPRQLLTALNRSDLYYHEFWKDIGKVNTLTATSVRAVARVHTVAQAPQRLTYTVRALRSRDRPVPSFILAIGSAFTLSGFRASRVFF